jgi:transposase
MVVERRRGSGLRYRSLRLSPQKRIADITRAIEDSANRDEKARRLMTIPGIGPLAATALLAAAGHGQQFKKGRDMAAWLGLVPQQYSTGGKPQMLGISKRGNRYVRRLLIHGARSCVTHLNRSRDRLGRWIGQLQSRMHVNKVTVALAAKIARIAWVILTRPGALYQRRDPAIA